MTWFKWIVTWSASNLCHIHKFCTLNSFLSFFVNGRKKFDLIHALRLSNCESCWHWCVICFNWISNTNISHWFELFVSDFCVWFALRSNVACNFFFMISDQNAIKYNDKQLTVDYRIEFPHWNSIFYFEMRVTDYWLLVTIHYNAFEKLNKFFFFFIIYFTAKCFRWIPNKSSRHRFYWYLINHFVEKCSFVSQIVQ